MIFQQQNNVVALKPPHLTNKKARMTKFLVNIWAYDYHAKFEVLAEDNADSIEKAVLDKVGEKDVKWESAGMFRDTRRITYEEVSNDRRPIQTKEVLGVRLAV